MYVPFAEWERRIVTRKSGAAEAYVDEIIRDWRHEREYLARCSDVLNANAVAAERRDERLAWATWLDRVADKMPPGIVGYAYSALAMRMRSATSAPAETA